MSNKTTSNSVADQPPPDHSTSGFAEQRTDWARVDALTDEEIAAAVARDPDAAPIDRQRSKSARRVGLHGVVRFRLRLSLEDFAARYHIPADTVWGWERGTIEPDAAAKTLVALIAADPDGVAATLAKQLVPAQAVE